MPSQFLCKYHLFEQSSNSTPYIVTDEKPLLYSIYDLLPSWSDPIENGLGRPFCLFGLDASLFAESFACFLELTSRTIPHENKPSTLWLNDFWKRVKTILIIVAMFRFRSSTKRLKNISGRDPPWSQILDDWPVDFTAIKHVIQGSTKFDKYLKKLNEDLDDEEIAREDGCRWAARIWLLTSEWFQWSNVIGLIHLRLLIRQKYAEMRSHRSWFQVESWFAVVVPCSRNG